MTTKGSLFFDALVYRSDNINIKWKPRYACERGAGCYCDQATGSCDNSKIDWWKTVMAVPDVKSWVEQTPEATLEDWRCTPAGTHPTTGYPCNPKCDLYDYMNVDLTKKTVYLQDVSETGTCPPDYFKVKRRGKQHFVCSKWWALKRCFSIAKGWEMPRNSIMQYKVKIDLYYRFFQDMSDPVRNIRNRMAFFFQNFYATPFSLVGDWILMYKQYYNIYTHALGDYRKMSLNMFEDLALRAAEDQAEEVECWKPPVENFGREWLERFTVGVRAMDESDVKRLAKGMNNCKHNAEDG